VNAPLFVVIGATSISLVLLNTSWSPKPTIPLSLEAMTNSLLVLWCRNNLIGLARLYYYFGAFMLQTGRIQFVLPCFDEKINFRSRSDNFRFRLIIEIERRLPKTFVKPQESKINSKKSFFKSHLEGEKTFRRETEKFELQNSQTQKDGTSIKFFCFLLLH
jgi:hypothetical protein